MTGTVPVEPYNLPDLSLLKDKEGFSMMVWQPDRKTLVLGQSNKAETSVFCQQAIADGISIIKRPSGGETVILTPETLVIAIGFSSNRLRNPSVYFVPVNNAIASALNRAGIGSVNRRGISDLALGEKKILGSSIYRTPTRVLYHAVLNVSESPETIARYIRHPAKEPDYRSGRQHADFVTSIRNQGFDVSVATLKVLIQEEVFKLSTLLPSL